MRLSGTCAFWKALPESEGRSEVMTYANQFSALRFWKVSAGLSSHRSERKEAEQESSQGTIVLGEFVIACRAYNPVRE